MTSLAWLHLQVTPVVLAPLASRPTDNFVGLVSYSGDANCVDAISFKTLSAWLHLLVLELVTCNELEWPTIKGNLFGGEFGAPYVAARAAAAALLLVTAPGLSANSIISSFSKGRVPYRLHTPAI
ncbi:hypothetical protein Taro_028351 [Colocasia esculenta]|uniref:Uncharacterized protein n=1 Tax=Colocasia esculenta TaxID=4460 RepID=A0A843VQ71_COLES|nr:hypothetical protein [Colocasia esculenta]